MNVSAVSPTCSDAAVSPTPSYDSAYSSQSSHETPVTVTTTSLSNMFNPASTTTTLPDAYDPLDAYESATSPEDEELLDAIALWQQCQ